jgi:hypothetical protein
MSLGCMHVHNATKGRKYIGSGVLQCTLGWPLCCRVALEEQPYKII